MSSPEGPLAMNRGAQGLQGAPVVEGVEDTQGSPTSDDDAPGISP